MKNFALIAAAIIALASSAIAHPKAKPHASREAAVELLRHEGILHGKTRVDSATWSGDFWLIGLHHPDGKTTNWMVDAKAENYSYVCQH